MIGARNRFVVSFFIIDSVFGVMAWLAYTWSFVGLSYFILAGLAINMFIQIQLLHDPKGGLSFVNMAVDDGFGNAIGKSNVQEHNTFLRFQVVNNIIFMISNLVLAGMVGMQYIQP